MGFQASLTVLNLSCYLLPVIRMFSFVLCSVKSKAIIKDSDSEQEARRQPIIAREDTRVELKAVIYIYIE